MKITKILLLFLCILLIFSGCIEEKDKEIEQIKLPIEQDELLLVYASGVGAWSSDLYLYTNGTFIGEYHDSNMGETGEGYPNGAIYICNYGGEFDSLRKIDDCTYSIKLKSITYDYQLDTNEILGGIKYFYTTPAGLVTEIGTEYLLCLPGKPIAEIPEGVWQSNMQRFDVTGDTLEQYLLYIPVDEYTGFYSY